LKRTLHLSQQAANVRSGRHQIGIFEREFLAPDPHEPLDNAGRGNRQDGRVPPFLGAASGAPCASDKALNPFTLSDQERAIPNAVEVGLLLQHARAVREPVRERFTLRCESAVPDRVEESLLFQGSGVAFRRLGKPALSYRFGRLTGFRASVWRVGRQQSASMIPRHSVRTGSRRRHPLTG
jgi:hypothetical protein